MLIAGVTALAQLEGSAEQTFVRVVWDILYSASTAIELNLNFVALLLHVLPFFTLKLKHNVFSKFGPTHWAIHTIVFLRSMLGPHFQTFQMKVITTFDFAIS